MVRLRRHESRRVHGAGAITEFGNGRVRVAGAVVDVNNLEAAFREPATMAQGLANAHERRRVSPVACDAADPALLTAPSAFLEFGFSF